MSCVRPTGYFGVCLAAATMGSLVTSFPLISVRDRVAERLSALAASALRSELREGATATYDLASGQRDAALGMLAAGRTPQAAFPDGIPWLVNDRVFLPPNATQVVGPIDPGPTRQLFVGSRRLPLTSAAFTQAPKAPRCWIF